MTIPPKSGGAAGKPLRILVIDDWSYNRQALSDILSGQPGVEVVGQAPDGQEGLKLASQLRPNLITLDIEMPRMDGFTFLRLLMAQSPTPVIVVSSHSRKQEVFQALELGALDFVAKPARFFTAEGSPLRDELVQKVLAVQHLQIVPFHERVARRGETGAAEARAAAAADAAGAPKAPAKPTPVEAPRALNRLVCIGASTGGPPALQSLFRAITGMGGTAFLVVQHMPEKFTRAFADRLDRLTGLNVREVADGEVIAAGAVYIAPGGMHVEVVPRAHGSLVARILPRAPSDHYVPSVDRLFTSVAQGFAGDKMAVVLTGMGNDGAAGIRAMRAAGGRTLAESPQTAIVFGMPKGAIDTGCVDEILTLDDIIAKVQGFAAQGS